MIMQRAIRKSELSDVSAIMELIADAQRFLRSCGVDQWQDGYPTAQIIEQDIALGQSYICIEQGQVVATAVISAAGEPTYRTIEGSWLNENGYVVVHRLAVSASATRRGLAREMMCCAEQFAHSLGLSDIRVDTHADNMVMQHLLERLDYQLCGQITLQSQAKRLAYHKRLK